MLRSAIGAKCATVSAKEYQIFHLMRTNGSEEGAPSVPSHHATHTTLNHPLHHAREMPKTVAWGALVAPRMPGIQVKISAGMMYDARRTTKDEWTTRKTKREKAFVCVTGADSVEARNHFRLIPSASRFLTWILAAKG